ncbi:S-layer homology domain-containing protein [bacterium]|nr:S-layer homology domain-containing protein [bacterium]
MGCSKTVKKESEVDTIKNHYLSGLQKLDKKDFKGAEEDFNRTVRLDKKSPVGYTGLALLEMERSDYKRALKMVNKAIEYDPNSVDALITRGRIITAREKDGWFDDARASFTRALAIAADNDAALFYCAESYLKSLDFTEALSWYGQAVKKNGPLKDRAAAKYALVKRIIEVDPVSEIGKQKCLLDKITRADLCEFLVEEFKIKARVEHHQPTVFEKIYGDNLSRKKAKEITPSDISSAGAKQSILDVIPLHISDIDILPGGRFYPSRNVTRAQLAMVVQGILVLLRDDSSIATRYVGTESLFPDVRPDYYAYNAVMLCVNEDIMKPVSPDNEFNPDAPVSGVDVIGTFQNLSAVLE